MEVGEPISSVSDLRQGDVVDVDWVPALIDNVPGSFPTPCGVAILSQTCDVVQEGLNKANVTVAPVVCSPDPSLLSTSRSGQSPLLLHLPGHGSTPEAIADVQRVASLPKSVLLGKTLLGRHTDADSSASARGLAERAGRIYSRFAFPDEVVLVLDRMKKKARKAAGGSGAFGRVLDHLDFRVRSTHWDGPGRVLSLFVIVKSALLIMPEDADPDWTWERSAVVGRKAQERVEKANFTRLSELLAETCEGYLTDPSTTDGTTLLRLWELWVNLLKKDLLDSQVNSEVTEFLVELVSDDEFPVSQWRRTVSLDLEDLSDPTLAADHE